MRNSRMQRDDDRDMPTWVLKLSFYSYVLRFSLRSLLGIPVSAPLKAVPGPRSQVTAPYSRFQLPDPGRRFLALRDWPGAAVCTDQPIPAQMLHAQLRELREGWHETDVRRGLLEADRVRQPELQTERFQISLQVQRHSHCNEASPKCTCQNYPWLRV